MYDSRFSTENQTKDDTLSCSLTDEPNKDRSGSRTSNRTSHRPSSRSDSADNNSPRQTQSAGSSGRRSRQGQEGHDAGFNRANSLVGLASPTPGESRPGSTIHKQVSLTTVKRNYETWVCNDGGHDFLIDLIFHQEQEGSYGSSYDFINTINSLLAFSSAG